MMLNLPWRQRENLDTVINIEYTAFYKNESIKWERNFRIMDPLRGLERTYEKDIKV